MKPSEILKSNKELKREISFKREQIDAENRSVSIAFSSEEPVERWFGKEGMLYKEILDHSKSSVDLGRFNDGGAVLWGHDPDQLIGVVESASIDDDRRGRAVIRFADTPDAENVWQKVQQGVARHVSVGYRIDEIEKDGEDETGTSYRATKWTPHEVSIVSVPADASVGVGRNQSNEVYDMTEKETPTPKEEVKRDVDAGAIAKQVADELRTDADKRAKDEADRCNGIRELAKEYGRETLAIEAIEGGKSIDDFRGMLLEATKTIETPPSAKTEQRIEVDYKRSGQLNAFPNDKKGLEDAYRSGQWARAVIFRDEKAQKWCRDYGVRVMTGTGTGDSSVVPDEMVQPIIDLREQYGVARQECYVHPMASDTATVPRRKTGVTAYFTGREDAITASDAAFDDVNLVARELSALTRISKAYAEDAIIDLGDFLAGEMAYAFAVKEDDCLFKGDGTSTYGGINGINNKILALAGAVDAASGVDTFAEVTNTDLVTVTGSLPMFPGIMPKWYASKKGAALTFGRLAAAAGGNTKETLGNMAPKSWDGDPIVISQSMPTSTGDLSNVVMMVYGDLNQGVTFGDRRGFEVQVLNERYAEYNQIGIIGRERFDIVVHGVGDASSAGPIVALIGE